MRLLCDDHDFIFDQRPFAGGRGASLYIGDGDPLADPGPGCIAYRRNTILDGADSLVPYLDEVLDLGAASVPKTLAVAQVEEPVDELPYTIPAELFDRVVWAQVRTFQDHVENESIYRPRRIVLDGSGDVENRILGSAAVVQKLALDGGGLRVDFVWTSVRDGTQPIQFALVRTAGPTSPSTATVLAVAGQRNYSITITGLQNAGAYTFRLDAEAGLVADTLISGITFSADAAGPPSVSGVTATEY